MPLLIKDRDLLKPTHIRDAAELPMGHAIRSLFANACVEEYILALRSSGKKVFKFQTELKEIHSFSSDLLESVGRSIIRVRNDGYYGTEFWDPLAKELFKA